MVSDGSKSVFWDTSIQPCKNPIRVMDLGARLYMFNKISEILFFNPGKGNESDAASIPAAVLTTPHQDTAFLSVNTFLEPDNTWSERALRLDADPYYTSIHDPDNIICAHEIMKRDDPQRPV